MKTHAIFLAAAVIALAAAPTAHAYTEQEIEASVVDTCQGSVKDSLKDPDSAKFSDWKAWIVTHHDKPPAVSNYHPENGDQLYSAGGLVNAKNSYGGYTGNEMWGCDAAVTTSGNIHAHAYSLSE
ncbi:hypothetical protein [Mycobacterium avium]|uniref:hypothetical protein n=1 Tax=Mycobacterium avium TaxID=1764 RepID=UPI000B4A5B89|nr:hypothetical protein [Mycobacterium avium]QBC87408.1 hypothetical protein B6K05_023585 [Mycobacterium avium subsp. hominissuis]